MSACSALLKPKCQKMSSTRCNIFSLKRKRFVKFCPFVSTHLEKIASRHAGHGQHQEWHYLHFDSCFQKFVHLCLIGGMPDRHSKDWGKIRADRHVKSVIEEITKYGRARLHPVLCCPFGRKKVNSTAMLRVLRQATVQNPQVRNGIVQVWIVLVAKRARAEGQFLWQHLGVSLLGPLCYFVRSKIGTSKTSKFSLPAVQ